MSFLLSLFSVSPFFLLLFVVNEGTGFLSENVICQLSQMHAILSPFNRKLYTLMLSQIIVISCSALNKSIINFEDEA